MRSDNDREAESPDQNDGAPVKRRKLLSKVCETCKQRKARCDNVQPQCGSCRRKGVACVYREKGQPGLRPGFGKALEQRMDALESNINRLMTDVDRLVRQTASSDLRQANTREPKSARGHAEHDGSPKNVRTQTGGMWHTPPPTISGPAPAENFLMDADQYSMHSSIQSTPSGLPSRQALIEIKDMYFKMVHPWCPLFLDETMFSAEMFSTRKSIILHGIVLAAIRFWQAGSETEREAYLKYSRDQILLQSINQCTIESTQALALFAVDALGNGTGPHCWNALCMLVTAARHLGIATNPMLGAQEGDTPLVRNDDEGSSNEKISAFEAEEKRRLFWVICSLDRLCSVAHGQPGGIDTKSIRMPYPSCSPEKSINPTLKWFNGSAQWTSTTASESLDPWHQYIDILTFADRCNQLLIQPVNLFIPAHSQSWQNKFRALDADISCWFASLPQLFRGQQHDFDAMATLLVANFQLIRIRMYTVAAFPSTTSPHVRPSSSARLRCREAIAAVAAMARSLESSRLDQLGPQFAFVLWVSARSIIILWTTAFETDTEMIIGDLDALMNGLHHLSGRWPSAGRYRALLQLIRDTKDGPDGAAGLDIFNDTRRTAHGLEKALGEMARRRSVDILPSSLDFLDMSFLDDDGFADPTLPFMSSFGLEADEEWFR